MLKKLIIDNYALIDQAVINFNEGFTVITGETGSGKSIMLDALALLMGSRADSKAIGNKERKMVVEAVFSDPPLPLEKIFEEKGLDWDKKELIIRREISPTGKSRGFINDTPVNLTILSEITSYLLAIHSQHKNSLINKSQEQLVIIDNFGKSEKIKKEYQDIFKEYIALRNKIKSIKEDIVRGKENKDFVTFRLEQLDKIKPHKGELLRLERELELLGDADRIKNGLKEAQQRLGGNNSVIKLLQEASSIIKGIDISLLNAQADEDLGDRLDSLKVEIRDISDTLESYSEKIEADPDRYEKVHKRIELLYEIMKRFKVRNEDELVNLHESLKRELKVINTDKTDITQLENKLKELAVSLKATAEELSDIRKKSSEVFSEKIISELKPLGLPNIKFQVDIQKGKLSHEGQDTITFNCSFNKNHPLQPVAEIASGGEIARVMLGIKDIMAEKMSLPTIIFDEIDTGVSGEIAHKMGKMMKNMSKNIQVIAVTHLPQVASNGTNHLKVFKADDKEKTISHIKQLTSGERIQEIASMLSGSSINDIALENARILLNTD